jgi:hypothetical protein
MANMPKTRYARSGDMHIAYQVMGDTPLDLVLVPGFISHLELQRTRDGPVLRAPGVLLPSDPLRQAGNRPLRSRGWDTPARRADG